MVSSSKGGSEHSHQRQSPPRIPTTGSSHQKIVNPQPSPQQTTLVQSPLHHQSSQITNQNKSPTTVQYYNSPPP